MALPRGTYASWEKRRPLLLKGSQACTKMGTISRHTHCRVLLVQCRLRIIQAGM